MRSRDQGHDGDVNVWQGQCYPDAVLIHSHLNSKESGLLFCQEESYSFSIFLYEISLILL